MPQLDKFTILFQFKSLFFVFFFFIFFFLFIIFPLIHVTLRLRRVKIETLLFSLVVLNLEIFRIFLLSYNSIKTTFSALTRLNTCFVDVFLIIFKKN